MRKIFGKCWIVKCLSAKDSSFFLFLNSPKIFQTTADYE